MVQSQRANQRGRRRRGAIESIELVVGLPILILALLGVIHFGLLLSGIQHVAFASRTGARAASRTHSLAGSNGDPVATTVREAVANQLQSLNFDHFDIQLEHNVQGPTVIQQSTVGEIECESLTPLSSPPPGRYVRVQVCVRLDEMTPDVLSAMGFSISGDGKVARQETTLPFDCP